jgi:hypothetical protein
MSRGSPSSDAADAVFVMMNPGSSKPLFEIEHLVDVNRTGVVGTALVPTKPDTTQYQIMRVMHEVGWTHVRVLNLSDLRDANSRSFAQRFPQLEQAADTSVHSIFARERAEELTAQLRRKPNAPVVCAWGVSDKLNPLIAKATTSLASTADVIGLAKPGQPGKYFHPLPSLQPRKEQWVIQMLEMLRRNHVPVTRV